MEAEKTTDDKENIGDVISKFLANGSFKETMNIIQSQQYAHAIHTRAHQLIPIFAERINQDIHDSNYDTFIFYESAIYKLAELCDPQDSIYEFMGYAENEDQSLFIVMLKALDICFIQALQKDLTPLSWCLSTILEHVTNMAITEDFKFEGDEYMVFENSDSSRNLISVLKEIIKFSQPLVTFILSREVYTSESRNLVLMFLIKLLGGPMVNMKLDFNKESPKTKGEFQMISEAIMNEIIKFKVEMTHFLNYISPYGSKKKTTVSNEVNLGFDNISLGVLYYLIFWEEVLLDSISHVYHPLFILQSLCTLALDFLVVEHSSVQNKGIHLLEASLRRLPDLYLDFDSIQCELFAKLSEQLAAIMIFSDMRVNRIDAVRVFKILLEKFDSKGRFYILYNIPNKESHPNFVGYIITIIKDFVVHALKTYDPIEMSYFTGENLNSILRKFCKLPQGVESDILELADQIIAALNFLRFLLIRDSDNKLGMVLVINYLETEFLEPLKTGLSLSIAHYKLQKSELMSSLPDEKFNVSIGGLKLPALSNEQKHGILDSALNTFDLIEALIARVEECLLEFKLKNAL